MSGEGEVQGKKPPYKRPFRVEQLTPRKLRALRVEGDEERNQLNAGGIRTDIPRVETQPAEEQSVQGFDMTQTGADRLTPKPDFTTPKPAEGGMANQPTKPSEMVK